MTTETALIEKKWTEKEITLIKNIAAPKCNDEEFQLLLYQARTYKLDPLLKQIWAVKYQEGKPASIFVGRDGFLSIAHQSGQFDGMESGVDGAGETMQGWARVFRKDMAHPFEVAVALIEYNKKQGNWTSMPRTMIRKVAESQALRKAFNISGVYSPEEMEDTPTPIVKPEPKEIAPVIDAEKPLHQSFPHQPRPHPFGTSGSEPGG